MTPLTAPPVTHDGPYPGDEFFSAAQIARLQSLMLRWRMARDAGQKLPDDEQTELMALIDAELVAATERAASWLRNGRP